MKAALAVILFFSMSIGHAQTKDSTAQTKDTTTKNKLVAPWWVEKFKLSAGFFLPINSTKVQVGANGQAEGTNIDFEKDLGFGAAIATFAADFQWRISRRSRINLAYFNMKRSNTHTLQKDITFDSTTYHVNSSVEVFFNTAIYQFSYGYAIIEKPTYELGVSIGAHTVGSKSGISLVGVNVGLSKSNDFGFTAPLPDLGIWGGYAFSSRFAANLDFSYLSLTVNNINGSVVAYNLVFTYKLLRQLDIALAYTGLNFDVKTNHKNVNGEFKWGYNGPSLGATFSFGKKSWEHPPETAY
jgi:hypothetical protein